MDSHTKSRQATLKFTKEVSTGKVTMSNYNFDQDKCRTSLGKMLILHEYPLSMVDHIGFRSFMTEVQPLFKVPSRNTIKNDILKIYDYEKSKMMILFKNNKGRISITTDMWTASNQKKGFTAITAHYIDDSWTLQSRIMRFIYVHCPHTAEVLSKELVGCLVDWNIDRKLSTLTLDNCTTNDAMINIVLGKLPSRSLLLSGEFFHMRCCAHILNLIVKDGLEIISRSVEKILESVVFWTATPKRSKKFEYYARQLDINCSKKLILDCKTRWNSTFLMLRTALQYKDVFPCLKQRESLYRCLPSEEDWNLAERICERLQVFFEVTELFSGTKYPTSNLFFPNICRIKLSLYDWITSPCVEIQMIASGMIEKFNKYWSEIHGILAVATVLDPRYKMKLVEYYYPRIFKDGALDEIENVRQVCRKLVQEYQIKHGLSGAVNHSSTSSYQTGLPKNTGEIDPMADFYEFVSSTSNTINVKTELDTFLDEPILPRSDNFDILSWWKVNAIKYPVLSRVARDVLAIPVSTVASESAFSTSGRFVSSHRNRLHPKTLEALMCAQDWLWGEIYANHVEALQMYRGCCIRLSDEDIDEEEPSYIVDDNSMNDQEDCCD